MMSGWRRLINGRGQSVQIYLQVIFICTHEKYDSTWTQTQSHQSQSTTTLKFLCVVCLSSEVGNCVSIQMEYLNLLSIVCFFK